MTLKDLGQLVGGRISATLHSDRPPGYLRGAAMKLREQGTQQAAQDFYTAAYAAMIEDECLNEQKLLGACSTSITYGRRVNNVVSATLAFERHLGADEWSYHEAYSDDRVRGVILTRTSQWRKIATHAGKESINLADYVTCLSEPRTKRPTHLEIDFNHIIRL